MPTVLEAVTHGQRQIVAREAAMTRRMVDAYTRLWNVVEGRILAYQQQIAEAAARGEQVNEAWLRQQTWYRQLQGSIDAEFQRFGNDAIQTVGITQMGAVQSAMESVRLFQEAIGQPFTGRVNAGALERWVSATRFNSPVRDILENNYGPHILKAVDDAMVDGIGSGKGLRQITREVKRKVGPEVTEPRLATIVRTEGMRAYRGSQADMFAPLQEDGIITGYRWLAAKSVRTCAACLGRDGKVTKTYPTDQHCNCRCVAQPVVDPELVPGGRERETGAEWLAKQPEDVQRRVLPNRAAFEAYRNGEAELADFVGVRQNRTWGSNIFVRTTPKVKTVPRRAAKRKSEPAYTEDELAKKYREDMFKFKRMPSSEGKSRWNDYKGVDYHEMNRHLRFGHPNGAAAARSGEPMPDWFDPNFATGMDEIFTEFTLTKRTRVYRGMSFDGGETPATFRDLQPGSVVTDNGYVSTTYNRQRANTFGGGSETAGDEAFIFDIEVPAGTNYVPLDGLAPGKNPMLEEEIVLRRGSRFVVENVTATTDEYGVKHHLVKARLEPAAP